MSKVELSNVSVDFESLLDELKLDLRSKGTWRDLLLSSTGTALLEYMAAIGVFNQYNIEMAFRESALHKAVRDSSIFGIARTLGVSIPRKTPTILSVDITNSSTEELYILPKSKFLMAGNRELFNPNQINIAPGQTSTVTLKEGSIKQKTFETSLIKYQEYLLNAPNFVVTDDDLRVYVRSNLSGSEELWTKTDSALWMHNEYDKIYFETTTAEGDVSIVFGDGTYGASPPNNSTIIVEYAITSGSEGSNNLLGNRVVYSNNSNLVGKIVDYHIKGTSEKSSQYYKLYASHMFKSRNRAISKTDYISVILGHRDVAGCTVLAQRDLYPNDPKWVNTIRICVLANGSVDTFGGTNPNPQSVKWQEFLDWLKPKIGWITVQTWNPTKIYANISVKIALTQSADALQVENKIRENVQALFVKDMYSLGKAIYISDINKACTVEGVDYAIIESPTENIKPDDDYHYIALGQLNVSVFYSERTSLPTYSI